MNELISINKIHKHMNLSYCILNDSIQNINLERSLLNGTVVNCESIEHCNLQLTEWTGAKVECRYFTESNLKYSEIKSTWFNGVVFNNVIFDDATICDCTFSKCFFVNCKLNGTFFQENTFDKCKFESIDFTKSSTSINKFNNCKFLKTFICGSFYYSIFNNCEMDTCKIDQYLLGYILGIFNPKNKNISYLKGKEVFDKDFEQLINITIQDYEKRMKFINLAILKLNLNHHNNIDVLLLSCIKAFAIYSQNDIAISSDDIKFISFIVEDYYKKNLISPCMIFEAETMIKNELKNTVLKSEINKKQLKKLHNCLYFCQQDYLIKNIPKVNVELQKEYILFIKYEEKPKRELINVLKTLIPNQENPPTLIKTDTGSFLEWIKCDGNAIIMLGLLLDFLGVSVPIIYDVIKEKKSKNGKKQKNVQHTELTNININQLQIVINNNNIENLANVLNTVHDLNFSVSNEFMGYNNSNIQEINISK